MQSKIMYIENKSKVHHRLAWIGFVEFSKSGQTVYFDGKALKKLKNPGICGNHFDIETGEEYWVSGVKKNGQNRHWCGGGKIMIDKNCIEEYLKLVDFNTIDEKNFTIIEFIKTDKSKFNELENLEIEFMNKSRTATYWIITKENSAVFKRKRIQFKTESLFILAILLFLIRKMIN